MRAAEPLISLEVLGNPIVLAGTLSMFLLQAANIGLAVYLPVYLQSISACRSASRASRMLGLLLGTVAGATFSGRMIPRFIHYKRIAMVGVTFSHRVPRRAQPCRRTCLAAGGRAPDDLHRAWHAAPTFPVATVSVQNAVDRMHLGVATGVLTFLRSLGSALGVAMLGAVALGYGLPLAERRRAGTTGHSSRRRRS